MHKNHNFRLIFILGICPENILQCYLFWTVTLTFLKFGVKAPSGALVMFFDKALVDRFVHPLLLFCDFPIFSVIVFLPR